MTITIYSSRRMRGIRILWACEEMGLEYETRAVNLSAPSAELLALNPSGTAPVLVDGETVITESIAAIQYLAVRYGDAGLTVGPQESAFADYLQGLMLGEAGLAAPLNVTFGVKYSAPEDQQDTFAARLVVDGFRRRLKLVEAILADGREFLVADRLTLADISVSYPIDIAASFLGLEPMIPPVVLDYQRRLYARPGMQRALARTPD